MTNTIYTETMKQACSNSFLSRNSQFLISSHISEATVTINTADWWLGGIMCLSGLAGTTGECTTWSEGMMVLNTFCPLESMEFLQEHTHLFKEHSLFFSPGHTQSISTSCFLYLHNLSRILPYLATSLATSMVQITVLPRLDSCSSLLSSLHGLPLSLNILFSLQ